MKNSINNVAFKGVAFEALENRTMMSVSALPHVAVAHQSVSKPLVSMKLTTRPAKASTTNFADPAVTDKSITYKSFSSSPLFSTNGPGVDDISQGYVGDCYLMSTLSSVAKTDPALIRKDIVANNDGTFTVKFGTAVKTSIKVDADLPVWPDGTLAYARTGAQGSIWVALIEKAYAQYKNPKVDSYSSIDGGWMTDAFMALGLSSKSNTAVTTPAALFSSLVADLKSGDFTTFGTASTSNNSPLVASHAYEVDHVNTDANGNAVSITFRNPWGKGTANNGYVTVSAQQAFNAFSGVVIAHA